MFLVRVGVGVFRGRLGVAGRTDEGWRVVFEGGYVVEPNSLDDCETICSLDFLNRLLQGITPSPPAPLPQGGEGRNTKGRLKMKSDVAEVFVADVRNAVNEGDWRRMRTVFEGQCLFDSMQVVVAAADCSIAGGMGRVARLLFDPDNDQHQEDYQDCLRMARLWFKAMIQSGSGPGGRCDAVQMCVAELQEVGCWKAIATVAQIVTESRHCKELFAKHLAFAAEDGSFGVEC